MALTQHTLTRHIWSLQTTILFCFILIVARLIYFQIIHYTNYFGLSTKNFTRTQEIQSMRGDILDCKGRVLATNKPVHHVVWNGTGKRTFTQEQEELASALENIAQGTAIGNLQHIRKAELHKLSTVVLRNISFSDMCMLLEQFPHNQNLSITTDFSRHYPHNTIASHVVGYLGSMRSAEGKMGLEKLYDDALQGSSGLKVTTINSFGSFLHEQLVVEAQQGEHITTSIDLDLQKLAEGCFEANVTGSMLVMDAYTGKIKVLLSRPSFDPNMFLERVSRSDWLNLLEQHALLNRAFNASYPPASIFKLVTMSAALEEGIVEPDMIWHCKGYTAFGGRNYHCNRRYGCGYLSVQEAVAKSCNTLFFDIGQKLSINTLAEYARRFGLGTSTQTMFTEKTGLIPSTQWKLETKGERWWPGETLSASIGQSYLLVTPVQIARMIASIFTGQVVQPRMLEHQRPLSTPLQLEKTTRAFLKKSMKSVVTEGTGKRIKSIKDIKVYAKTGTAQTSDLAKRKLGGEYLEHALLVAYFRYQDTDPLVLVTLIEHAGSTKPAITCAKKFLLAYRDYMKQQ